MAESLSFDVGSAYPFVEQRILQIFGKDASTVGFTKWLTSLQCSAIQMTDTVQCVGMSEPVPFDDIYQPTRIFWKDAAHAGSKSFSFGDRTERSMLTARTIAFRPRAVDQFLESHEDAIIFAGPGWGKTTFMSYVFRTLLRSGKDFPILITLNRPTSVDDIERVVDESAKITNKAKNAHICLLVDGMDEVKLSERRRVADAIVRFQGLKIGSVIMACREHYQVPYVNASEIRLGGFNLNDKYRFARTFLSKFQPQLNYKQVVDHFEAKGFSEFLSHPLLLALACIVHTSTQSVRPTSGLKLITNALDVLRYRWDERKGISRDTTTSVDGRDRIEILQRIAASQKTTYVPGYRAMNYAKQELVRLKHDKVDPALVLQETAQFYGIFVPIDNGWQFVHRTLQDYLAAEFEVETGEFAKKIKHDWNARTAYAACRMRDATNYLLGAFNAEDGLPIVAEILDNSPRFDHRRVASALANYFASPGRVSVSGKDHLGIAGALSTAVFRSGDSRFLNFLVEEFSSQRSNAKDLMVGICLLETQSRKSTLDFHTYSAALAGYGSDRFTFRLYGFGDIMLRSVKPSGFDAFLATKE